MNDQENILPFSQACENNKLPISKIFKEYKIKGTLLEMGHGTGQHAEFFAKSFPQVIWQPTDLEENNWMINKRIQLSPQENLLNPLPLKAGDTQLNKQVSQQFKNIFTANTLHIMSEANAISFCEQVHSLMQEDAMLFLYGPFKFEGQFTTESNARFDLWLKNRDPNSGIRDFELVKTKLENTGLSFVARHDLPANNHILVFNYSGN